MKKFFLFAALFAAISLNAEVIDVDLAQGVAKNAEIAVSEGVLTATYDLSAWGAGGVEFPLDNLAEVTSISFDYKGDGKSVVLYAYLRDTEGARWRKGDYYPSLSSTDWKTEAAYVPDALLWDAAEYAYGERPFKKIGFIANPSEATAGSFSLRNIKITVPGGTTAIDNANANAKASKIIRDGQVLIIRDGRTFNALGAEIK